MSRKTGPDVRVSTLQVGQEEYAVIAYSLEPAKLTGQLTRAEREVARLALDGHSNAEIARIRGTSQRTVANQMASLFRKLHLSSRAELARACVAAGDDE